MSIPIPNSLEEAGAEDRMLLHMRDTENKSWAEINAAWESMTGVKPGASMLNKRYARMKANFAVFPAQHVSHAVAVAPMM